MNDVIALMLGIVAGFIVVSLTAGLIASPVPFLLGVAVGLFVFVAVRRNRNILP